MKKSLFLIFVVLLTGWIIFRSTANKASFQRVNSKTAAISETDTFSLKKGDLLVRPNWEWLPGSCPVPNGRMLGHLAVVQNDVSGNSVQDVLSRAMVIEAILFDQRTRKFIFNNSNQVREIEASISFGPRFKGVRYRLRMPLTEKQRDDLLVFLKNQIGGRYSIFSTKKTMNSDSEKIAALHTMKRQSWHCATISWQAYHLATGADIDENQGMIIYPADIIASKLFDGRNQRVKF
jgi:hypothetical protein